MITLSLILLLILLCVLVYQRVNLYLSSLCLVSYTALAGFLQLWSYWFLLPLLLCLIPFVIPPLRARLFSLHLLRLFHAAMPVMSTTEKEAINAGTTWWEGDLFQGNPDWQKLHRFPAPQLTKEEQAFLEGPVETVCKMANDFVITHQLADLPVEIWNYLKEQRFFAMIIKKEYGGLAFSAYAQSRVLQKLSGVSSILSITVGVPNSLGPGELLQHYGTDAQKNHYLPRLARGEEIPCFALTSPEAGSDASAIPDSGVVCMGEWQGETQLGIRLTWNKRYITLAPVATVLGLAFKLFDPEHLLGDQEELGITCALIPTNTQGVKIGTRHFPLNIPFMNGPTRGNDVFVPIDYIIGGAAMAGKGWKMLVECLSVGRGITLPSSSTGGLKSIALATGAYAHIRRQFKMPIGNMEGIEEPLARIAGNAYLMDAASTLITTAIGLGEKPAVLSAITKYHCTHRSQRAIIDAMDILGGRGICMGSSNFTARAYQGAPIAITVEGANILTRSMIIFGQGAIRCHPFVLQEIDAAQTRNLPQFDKAIFGHLGFVISNVARSFWLGLTHGRFSPAPYQDETTKYYRQMNRLSANLALLADVCMGLLGGSLKRHERISARLGDILSQLYLSSAVLKRFDEEGRQKSDLPLLHWAIQDSLYQAQQAIDALLNNLPSRSIACVLRCLLFPLGKPLKAPADKLDHQVAQLLQTPSTARARLGRGQFVQACANNPVGLLEQALLDIIAAEIVHKKLCEKLSRKLPFMQLDKLAAHYLASGELTATDADILIKAEASRLRSINVDEFAFDALAVGEKNHPITH